MDRKIIFNKRASQAEAAEPGVSSYKNQNVIFKIHSPKGQQNYNAKTFPAKFSINICNQPTQITSGMYNREYLPMQTSPNFSSPNKNDFENVKTERLPPSLDLGEYDRKLKVLMNDKRRCDQLVAELQENCHDLQRQNQELANNHMQKDSKIAELEVRIQTFISQEAVVKSSLLAKQTQNKQLKQNAKVLQAEIKKLKEMLACKTSHYQSELKRLEARIGELEGVIIEKEQTIKNLSNFNNQISRKILDQNLYNSTSHVKQMEKWLKMLNKRYEYNVQESMIKTQSSQSDHNSLITELMYKGESMSAKIIELEKLVNYLDIEQKRTQKQNQHLISVNQNLKKTNLDLQLALEQKQMQKQTHQSFFRRTLGSSIGQNDGTVVYQGTVKVKMETLLIQKDKRISTLQSEIFDTKKQNSLLRSKLYQLDCQQDFANESIAQQQLLRKTRSMGSFYWPKSETGFKNESFCDEKENKQLFSIMSQCNSLTQTLGNFMEACHSEKPLYEDNYRRTRLTQAFSSTQSPHSEAKQFLNFRQKRPLQNVMNGMERNSRLASSREVHKCGHNRCESFTSNYKQSQEGYPGYKDPITERIFRPDASYRRVQRTQKSCYMNQANEGM